MCIAGIFGGSKSGITAATTTIFLESAYFSPAWVRKTSMQHQLKTDASFRFERGADPEGGVAAIKRAAAMICEISGGHVSSELVDVYPNKQVPATFTVKKKNLDRLIGKEIPAGEVHAILERLDIQVSDKKPDSFQVSVPTYRVEVKQEADIVEEVLRIYGFNNIPLAPHAGSTFISEFPAKDPGKYRRSIGELLVANGYFEIMTNSLTNAAYYERHSLATGLELVPILNKLSEELGVMRATMLFSGLEVCAFNINRKQKNLKLFEFGKIYGRKGQGYHEAERLAIFLSGQVESDTWQRPARSISYSDLSQAVADILDKSAIRGHQLSPLDDPMFEYGMCIVSGKLEIGRMGKVKQSFQKDFGLKQEIFYADIDAALLFNAASPKFDVQEVPRFPEVRRDLSIVLDKQVTYREIEELVRNTEKRLIKDIIVFDVYEGDKIQQGKKAYALGFTLLDESKTLTDEEIDRTMNKLIGAFEDKMKAVIRK